MINLQDYDVFIFDCDGVILDSNSLKSDAFRSSLKDEDPSKVDELVKYHKQNGGISRYKKFEHFFTKTSPCSNSRDRIDDALKKFAETVSREMLEVDTIPGAERFINLLHKMNKRLFVNSGSDEEELRKVFQRRNLDLYFDKVYGSPRNKYENIERISNFCNISKRCIFIGDSISDFQASTKYDMDFMFISGSSEWEKPDPLIEKRFKNFIEILEILL